jgi:hypothetical protein
MGISGLAKQLEAYATRYTSTDLDGRIAIIDGPALAYYAHKLAAEASNTRPPSYGDINLLAIRWLKALESVSVKV